MTNPLQVPSWHNYLSGSGPALNTLSRRVVEAVGSVGEERARTTIWQPVALVVLRVHPVVKHHGLQGTPA